MCVPTYRYRDIILSIYRISRVYFRTINRSQSAHQAGLDNDENHEEANIVESGGGDWTEHNRECSVTLN